MKKSVISVIIATLMILSSVSGFAIEYGAEWNGYTAAQAAEYKDVPADFWGHDAIIRTTAKNWFSGYPDGTFRPNASIKRAEALKVFVQFLGLELKTVTQTSYYDVDPGAWYAPYIEAGKKLFPARTQFNGQTPFQPDMPITREDAVYALVIATRHSDGVTFADQSILNMFSDKNSISESIKSYIAVATNLGLVSGYSDGRFGGQDPLTRAEFATILYRATTIGFGNSELDLSDDTATIESVVLNPETSAELDIGETLTLTALATYTNGLTADYTNELIAYVENGSSVTANKNVIKAVSAGVSTIKFSNAELADKSIIVVVQAPNSTPTITVNAESTVTTDKTVITGRASDPSGASFTVTCDGREVAVNSAGEFKEEVSLEQGTNTFLFEVENEYGKTASKTVKIRYNAPSAEATSEPVEEPDDDDRDDDQNDREEEEDDDREEAGASLVSFAWSVSSLELNAGETSRIKLIGTYSDGSTKDLTSSYSLYSTNDDVATVDEDGNILAVGEGTAKISMGSSSLSSVSTARPLSVKVNASSRREMEKLEWSVSSLSLSVGATKEIKLYAVYSDGSKEDVTEECGIYAMDEEIAVVSGSTIKGVSAGSTELWFDSMPNAGIDLPRMLNVTVD